MAFNWKGAFLVAGLVKIGDMIAKRNKRKRAERKVSEARTVRNASTAKASSAKTALKDYRDAGSLDEKKKKLKAFEERINS